MAALGPELLVLSDAGRFRADNLLGAEDWDAALFGCLDDRLEPAPLFPPLDPDPVVDAAFGGGAAASPPDPPWDPDPPRLFPELQVKSEPGSPTPSRCSDASDPPAWAPTPPEAGVKTEPPPPLPCAPPEPGGAVKAEGPPPLPPPSRRTPPIQPKPPGGGAPSPPQPLLLQPLPGAIAVPAPAVLLPGLLCLPPPARGPPRGPPRPEAKAIVPAPAPAPPGPPEVDAQALKRQQRMIRNREAACQSRRRRKEYVQGLEERLRLALADNDRLRRENAQLRRRLDALLGQKPEARRGPRQLACLAALLLLLAFNLGPSSLWERRPPEPPPPPRGRRHLLGVAEPGGGAEVGGGRWGGAEGRAPPRGAPPAKGDVGHGADAFRNASLGPLPLGGALPGGLLGGGGDCRRLNRSESLRLADELSGWVRRHQGGGAGRPPRSKAPPPRQAPPASRTVPAAPPRPEWPPPAPLQPYAPPRSPPPLLAALRRRPDTFYVVSFRRDHLLLPATSPNRTARPPRMSLLLPAANESQAGGGALQAMMQVDCEVIDTRVVHLRGAATPPGPPATPPPRRRPIAANRSRRAPPPPRKPRPLRGSHALFLGATPPRGEATPPQ